METYLKPKQVSDSLIFPGLPHRPGGIGGRWQQRLYCMLLYGNAAIDAIHRFFLMRSRQHCEGRRSSRSTICNLLDGFGLNRREYFGNSLVRCRISLVYESAGSSPVGSPRAGIGYG